MLSDKWKYLSEEDEKRIDDCVRSVVEADGDELVELRFSEEHHSAVLTAFIWRQEGISLDDCERVHNALSDALDAIESLFPDDYVLNVSSMGLDRPVVTDDDFRRSLGVELEVVDGKKKTHGVLTRYDADTFTLSTEGKKPEEITISRNNKAKVQPYIRF